MSEREYSPPTSKLYQALATLVQARRNCIASNNDEWMHRHTDAIKALVKEHMPSGGGFDNGTALDLDASRVDRLVFTTSFHHMTEGMYDGWTEHTIRVTPDFVNGVSMTISGRDRNQIKDYVHDAFYSALQLTVTR